jgi:hypothetical protein
LLLRRALSEEMNDRGDFLDGVVHCSGGLDPE